MSDSADFTFSQVGNDLNGTSAKTDSLVGRSSSKTNYQDDLPDDVRSEKINAETEDPITAARQPIKRSKVPFEKGYSQMDWLKLMRTHPDLAGLKGRSNRRLISMEEVKQHKTDGPIWTVLKGRVYNISPYMKFHPGGVDMLMKAAGKDSTALFNRKISRGRDGQLSRRMRTAALLSPSSLPYPRHLPALSAIGRSSPQLALAGGSRICGSFAAVPPPSSILHFGSKRSRNDFKVRSDEGDGDAGGPDGYDMDEEDEVEEIDNKKDYDVEYDRLLGTAAVSLGGSDDIRIVESKSFVSTRGWDSETVVDYRINEEEFHKISLLHCDFFIRKPPDPDNNVYDFREMYVTPPDTDIYAIPKVLSPMPQKYIRLAKSDFGCYNVTEPPIDAPRDPLYKTEREILKVFLTKHYRNRRFDDPDFVMDFEEIYVIDSKTKSISRAKVLVTVPGGRERDRRNDLLIVRDAGASFKIIDKSKRDDPTTVIEREEWIDSRKDMEKHLRKLRDFSTSNWF